LLAELEEQRLMVLEDKPSAQAWLVGYFESPDEASAAWKRLAETANADWSKAKPELRELPDVDWKDSYKAHFKASKFGRLNWVPVWEREKFVLPRGEEVLWLDPGMAFGTGNHETTRLCCERLAQHATRRGNSGRVIDAGCGSGILALSAAKLGFREISGFDNDPEAIRVSQENAALNELAGRVNFHVGDLVTGLAGRQAELVLANIQADVLMRFVDGLCAAVAPGGELVLSGILSRELDEVRTQFAEKAGHWKMDSRVLGEWADLSLVR
jgi:ribosomal protein L11 methyltransferase